MRDQSLLTNVHLESAHIWMQCASLWDCSGGKHSAPALVKCVVGAFTGKIDVKYLAVCKGASKRSSVGWEHKKGLPQQVCWAQEGFPKEVLFQWDRISEDLPWQRKESFQWRWWIRDTQEVGESSGVRNVVLAGLEWGEHGEAEHKVSLGTWAGARLCRALQTWSNCTLYFEP